MDFPERILKAARNAQEIKIKEGSVAWRVGGAFSQCLELQGERRRQGSETREEKRKRNWVCYGKWGHGFVLGSACM